MSHDEFTRLFTYMSTRFDAIEAKLEHKADKTTTDSLIGLVDSLAKRQEICDEERLVTSHQLSRLESWMELIAHKLGVNLAA